MSISHLIATYGYAALFALVAAEYMGIPVPGETALIIAGIYAGHTHKLDPWLIFAVAAVAAFIGAGVGYWIGEKGGYPLARRYGHRIGLHERNLKIARYLFDTHGGKVVFFGRFVTILRTYMAFLAGTSRMRWRRFLAASAAGAIAWSGVWTLASYLFGSALRRASGTIDVILAVGAVLVFTAAVLAVRRRTARLADRAEAAYPGPLT